MKPARRILDVRGYRSAPGFSLVEVTIAIGIFAFVIVAILGLFPVALRQRSDAALETRAVLVAQQIFESIRSSPSTNRVYLPPLTIMGAEDPDLRFKSLGAFPVTLQFGRIGTSALRPNDGDSGWTSGATETDADALARVSISPVAGVSGLYRATVDYGRPASLPEAKRKNFSFTKLVTMP
jgi:Tfp pilus assembly protein PilV